MNISSIPQIINKSAFLLFLLVLLGCAEAGLAGPQAAATLSLAQAQATSVGDLENNQRARQTGTSLARASETQAVLDRIAQETAEARSIEAEATQQAIHDSLSQERATLQAVQAVETSVGLSLTIASSNLQLARIEREIQRLQEERELAELSNLERITQTKIELERKEQEAEQERLSRETQATLGRQSEGWRSLVINGFFFVLPIAGIALFAIFAWKALQILDAYVKGKGSAPQPMKYEYPTQFPPLPAGYAIVPEELVMSPQLLESGELPLPQELLEESEDPLTPGRGFELSPGSEFETLPMGTSLEYPEGWWPTLQELDSILIAGMRRMGKTTLLRCIIESLIWQKKNRLILADGKRGVEFGQYIDCPRCEVLFEEIFPSLENLYGLMNKRIEILRESGTTSLDEYNALGVGNRLNRVVIVIDELMHVLQEDGVEDLLVDLVARGGAFGIHPILATQHPSVEVITSRLKANLATRIALPVASSSDSRVILDRSGADRLPKIPGRYLVVHNASLMQVQSFIPPERGSWKKVISTSRTVPPEDTLLEPAQDVQEVENLLESADSTPPLSELELVLIEAALANSGRFVLDVVHSAAKQKALTLSKRNLNKLAQEWETQGFLIRESRQSGGQAGSRIVSQELQDLFIECGGRMPVLS